jgi:branched-chain amino acid transport system ATP-binding protein
MLEVDGIHTYYGLSHILFDVSLKVDSGQVVCLLGRNGAGKTTTLKSIMGLTPPKRGRITYKNENTTGKAPYILARNEARIYDLFPALGEIPQRKGGLLSGGEQKMLAIARALMTNPEFLLLDEPTEGLAPTMVYILDERIRKLKEIGSTVLLAEQNVKFALGLSDFGYIIDNGRIYYQGSVKELNENEDVRTMCGI